MAATKKKKKKKKNPSEMPAGRRKFQKRTASVPSETNKPRWNDFEKGLS
jgi:hypothetical protein